MPESWLKDLKKAVQEGKAKLIITTILSSSLLTGIVSTGASFYLESRKSNLAIKTTLAKNKLESYSLLSKDIGKFESDLDSALLTFKYALGHPEDKNFEQNIGRSIDVLSEQMGTLLQTTRDLNIDPDTRKLIRDTIRPLGPKLATAQGDHNSTVLTDVVNSSAEILKVGVLNIKNQIEKATSTINAEL